LILKKCVSVVASVAALLVRVIVTLFFNFYFDLPFFFPAWFKTPANVINFYTFYQSLVGQSLGLAGLGAFVGEVAFLEYCPGHD